VASSNHSVNDKDNDEWWKVFFSKKVIGIKLSGLLRFSLVEPLFEPSFQLVRSNSLFFISNHYLPGREAGRAEQVTARLDAHVLVVFGADLAQLEGGAHFAVELVLLLRHLDVILGRGRHRVAQVRIHRTAVRIQVTANKKKQSPIVFVSFTRFAALTVDSTIPGTLPTDSGVFREWL